MNSSVYVKEKNSITLDDLIEFSRTSFNFLHLNINSIKKKAFDIHDILSNAHFDIVCFSETRLGSSVPSKPFLNINYKLYRYDRPLINPKNKPGGGIFIYIKKTI